jgi:ribokinase
MKVKVKSPRSVLVIGSLNMDLVLQVPRMPLIGESLVGSSYSRIPGGKGANQAVALARLGAKVTFAGKVGNDTDGEELVENLNQNGIATEFVSKAEDSSTGLAVILLDSNENNAITVFPGANDELTIAEVERVFARDRYDALVLQLEIPDQVIVASCRLAQRAGIMTFLDAGPARPFPLEELWGIDVLSPNETEVLALTGIEVKSLADAKLAAAALITRTNAKAVVIKLGSSGALLRTRQGVCVHFPAYKVDVIDPTAAGDAFTAALAFRYLETGDFEESVLYANLAGALATTRLGAGLALPTALEIEQFRQRLPQKLEAHV